MCPSSHWLSRCCLAVQRVLSVTGSLSRDGSSSFQSSSSTFLIDFGVSFSYFFPPLRAPKDSSIGKCVGRPEQPVQGA